MRRRALVSLGGHGAGFCWVAAAGFCCCCTVLELPAVAVGVFGTLGLSALGELGGLDGVETGGEFI